MHGSSHGIWQVITNYNETEDLDLANSKTKLIDIPKRVSRIDKTNSSSISSKRASIQPASISNNAHFKPASSKLDNRSLLDGYSSLVNDRHLKGWSCDLLTILFSQLPGRQNSIINQMKDEIQRIYSTFVTRTHRSPRGTPAHELPLFVGAADLPTFKHDRKTSPVVRCNGGLHYHVLIATPPSTRLRESVHKHFHQWLAQDAE